MHNTHHSIFTWQPVHAGKTKKDEIVPEKNLKWINCAAAMSIILPSDLDTVNSISSVSMTSS